MKSFADVNNDVYYNEFDVVNVQFDGLLNELGIDKPDIFSWPITVIVHNGDGFQVTGPNSIYFIQRIIDDVQNKGESDVPTGTQMPIGYQE